MEPSWQAVGSGERKWLCGMACSGQSAGPRDGAGEVTAMSETPDLGPEECKGLSSTPPPMIISDECILPMVNERAMD